MRLVVSIGSVDFVVVFFFCLEFFREFEGINKLNGVGAELREDNFKEGVDDVVGEEEFVVVLVLFSFNENIGFGELFEVGDVVSNFGSDRLLRFGVGLLVEVLFRLSESVGVELELVLKFVDVVGDVVVVVRLLSVVLGGVVVVGVGVDIVLVSNALNALFLLLFAAAVGAVAAVPSMLLFWRTVRFSGRFVFFSVVIICS